MVIEELFAAIHEKEEALQRIRVEAQRIEKDIETLKAAAKILEREKPHLATEEPPSMARTGAPETIRKAFP